GAEEGDHKGQKGCPGPAPVCCAHHSAPHSLPRLRAGPPLVRIKASISIRRAKQQGAYPGRPSGESRRAPAQREGGGREPGPEPASPALPVHSKGVTRREPLSADVK